MCEYFLIKTNVFLKQFSYSINVHRWEGEDDYSLKLPIESWSNTPTNNDTKTITSKTKLFPKSRKNDRNRDDLSTREVFARVLMNVIILFLAAAKFVVSV